MSEALVQFLYLLARDHLPTGVVRGIISAHIEHEPQAQREYSDPDLEAWARKRAEELIAADGVVKFEGWEKVE